MKRTLLISVAAVALAAGSTVALSQGSGGGSSGAGAGTSAPMANPSAPSGGQDTPSTKGTKGAQERAPADKQQKSTEQAPKPADQGTTTRQTQGEQPTKSQQTQSPATSGKTTDTKTGQQGAGGNVALTTEQKTTIRSTVINSGPKVTNVNFAVKVGTVVPRTVRIAPLPATLIEIRPAWRGYMYFVYQDEIIVVEPGTLRIVAVLEV